MQTPKFLLALSLLAASTGAALAQDAPGSFGDSAIAFTFRGGVQAQPEYFGSEDYTFGPDIGFSDLRLRLGSLQFGGGEDAGIGFSGSFRLIPERSADDFPELTGLEDVDMALELGFGVDYTTPGFEAFAELRYGVVGHESLVGELGADAVFRPTDQFTLRLGPRMFVGSEDYAETYFGVTAAESAASGGALASFDAEGGVLSAGVELGMTYQINDDWGLDSAVTYEQFLGSAADSPIVTQGSDESLSVRVGVTRAISFGF